MSAQKSNFREVRSIIDNKGSVQTTFVGGTAAGNFK